MEIVLKENEPWSESKKNDGEKHLELNADDIKLGEFLHDKKILDFRRLEDKGLQIKAKQFVGTVNFSKFKLKIIPKIYNKDRKDIWKNLVTCIYFSEGYPLAKIVEFEKNEFVGDDEYILQEFIIWRLIFQCKELIKRGLLKSYVTNEENLSVLRGKIILKNQFLNDVQKNIKFYCEYDELEYDNIDNRIIFYTLLQSRKLAISSELKKNIFMLLEQFSGIIQNVPITIMDIDRVMRSYTRQNMHYEDIHRQCRLIIKNTRISDFDNGDIPYSVPFFVDMNKIFEEFVTKLIEFSYPGQVDSQVRQKAWKVNNKEEPDSKRFMIPDIILRINKSIKIIDVKYKPKLDPSDLYQIGFYIHEFRKKGEEITDNSKKVSDTDAFAILPDYVDSEKGDKNFTSFRKEIQVYQRFMDLDYFIKLIRVNEQNDKRDEIHQELERMLDPNLESKL